MPVLFGLCVFSGFPAGPSARVCAFGALAGLSSLAMRPLWQGPNAALGACAPFFALGAWGTMVSAQWASPAWCVIAAGMALGLALRAPFGKLAGLASLALLGGFLVQSLGRLGAEPMGAWLYLSLFAGALAAAFVMISHEPEGKARTPLRLFLLDLAPADRLAVFTALETAWANGAAHVDKLQAGRGNARSLHVMRRNGALLVRWCRPERPEPPMPLAPAPAPFQEREIAELAHEMRTPVHQILGFAEVIELQMLGPIEASYAEYAGLIGVSGKHLLDLTDSWLERARLQSGARTLDTEDFDLHDLAGEALRGFGELARLKRLSLTLEGTVCRVRADRRAWRQILINLVGNALKFSPEGGVVRVAVGREGAMAVLEVEDSGPGIAMQDRARILRPFERGPGAGTQDGVGLGLSIVAALVGLHRGDLAILDGRLGGALFRASAPIGQGGAVAGLEIEQGCGEIPRLEQHP